MARRSRGKQASRRWTWLVAALLLVGMWQLLERRDGPLLPADSGTGPAGTPHGVGNTGASDIPLPLPSRSGAGPRADPALAFLPAEAHATLALIDRGGPYPHRQDGGVFQNRERLLPQRPHGHYREYTVDTPGSRDRGARRIVTGGDPPMEWHYTADHYRSFRSFERGDRP
ncbi:ribonuclease domain-containing protein [Luteimonas sp. MJ174]|uniref:ribonuclease domain-containing protein n=1 Tax=Luteimonas sp. MJ174 TaxID=3129237 RepID=UPI0031BA2400